MVTFYGSHICSGCREAKELFGEKGFEGFQFVEITESTDNLRAFLKLRDTREELREAKEAGRIGIPALCGKTVPSPWSRTMCSKKRASPVKISAKLLNKRRFPIIMDADWYFGRRSAGPGRNMKPKGVPI